jgi:cytochrome c-type biogenesis protein CcmH
MRSLKKILLSLAFLALAAAPLHAVEPDEILPDSRLESRARTLSAELRCLVCQNQSIDDSQAPLAKDLRVLVRQRLQAGDSDEQVRKYLVDRYGDFILLKPPFKTETLLLWVTPGAVLLLGAFAVWFSARRRRKTEIESVELSEAERLRLQRLLGES